MSGFGSSGMSKSAKLGCGVVEVSYWIILRPGCWDNCFRRSGYFGRRTIYRYHSEIRLKGDILGGVWSFG